MEIYKIENLSFSYPDCENKALRDLSFSVNEGEFVTICGLSGCGKSTLLRHMKTALHPYGTVDGNIYYRGKPLDETDELTQAAEIGFVMQSPDNQSITDKVWHELAFGLENLGTPPSVIRRKTAETALFFGLSEFMYKKVSELSGGQKQALNLASVMIQEPSVLILDEPTSQLDPVAAEKFILLLKKIHSEFGTTIILCEHTLEQLCEVSDRIAVMDKGRIIFEGTPQETARRLFERNAPLLEEMPVSARVSAACNCSCQKLPMTIGEGKRFLREYTENKSLLPIEHSYRAHEKNEKPALELKNVFFRYDRKEPDVLKGISFSAWSGEIVAVLGGNGSGKTTLLNAISGIIRPYSGSSTAHGKVCLLPQDPQTLFLKDTVIDDLASVFSEEFSVEEQTKNVNEILELCGLTAVNDHHPYDLSGGEQQKAALAKVLLHRPDILLLDEPVKGMDVKAKAETGALLKSLAEQGICVVIVSHDTEFCAEYADRCAFLFDGDVISEAHPDVFFSENTFFTTSASRMAGDIIKNAVTANDIRKALSLRTPKSPAKRMSGYFRREAPIKKQPKAKKTSFLPFIAALVLFIAAAAMQVFLKNKTLPYSAVTVLLSAILIFAAAGRSKTEGITIRPMKRGAGDLLKSILPIFAAIPITILIGVYLFGDAKYLFISLLIMLECSVPFFAAFENRHIRTRELVLISVMCAFAVTARAAFYMLPQFKPTAAAVIVSGAALGAESGFLIGSLSMLVSNILFGQGPWTPWQMFGMGLIGFLSGVIFGSSHIPKNKYSFSAFGLLAVPVIYGGIMNPAALIMSHEELTKNGLTAYYLSGLPLDIVHGISTAAFLFFAAVPIIKKIERVKTKYGLISQ